MYDQYLKANRVDEGTDSYAEVVTLEDPQYPQHPERIYSVTYERGHGEKKGVLSPGGSVKVKEGMEFDVTATNRS